ncbi:hypothetical protein [Salinivibrio sp. ES.052]|uniref:hypothetical protein n=1 Tax=Salinivibrio sp. ES.052 TaxID=1882823 RepID=UPI000925EE21|nr:hypothetical protein [Salinivibrio sp. ES.052]SIO32689.1 hypothetical protein SAMN05444724_2711 [Salinivibrio sp. ES.052]
MLDDLVSLALRQFQQDCVKLCEHHYPTVHNRGMRDPHMGKALARRLMRVLEAHDKPATFNLLDDTRPHSQTVYQLQLDGSAIYILAHRLLSGNNACRDSLVRDVAWLLNHGITNPAEPGRVIVVSDHWIDRTNASKSVPSWWLGHQPIHADAYRAQGIRLTSATSSLAESIAPLGLTEGRYRIFHPLFRKKDGLPLHKYLLLTATFPFGVEEDNNTL